MEANRKRKNIPDNDTSISKGPGVGSPTLGPVRQGGEVWVEVAREPRASSCQPWVGYVGAAAVGGALNHIAWFPWESIRAGPYSPTNSEKQPQEAPKGLPGPDNGEPQREAERGVGVATPQETVPCLLVTSN